jgi:hypothetical protein
VCFNRDLVGGCGLRYIWTIGRWLMQMKGGGWLAETSIPEKEESAPKKSVKKIEKNSKTITRRVIAAGPRKRPHMRPAHMGALFCRRPGWAGGSYLATLKSKLSAMKFRY